MEGVTYLLNCSAGDKWHGKFEETLRLHLAIPAVRNILTPLAIRMLTHYSLSNLQLTPNSNLTRGTRQNTQHQSDHIGL
jgi:hypothetical protein